MGLMKQILLLIVATILIISFLPITFITFIIMIFIKDSRERYRKINKYSYALAYCVDLLGNVLVSPLFNLILIKHNGYLFGFPGETISSVLGKNIKLEMLTKTGKKLVRLLDYFEKNHCLISIQDIGNNDYGI